MTVDHDPATHQFTVTLPEGGGSLRYRVMTDGVLDLFHTEVDPGLQGRGVAGALAAAAFAYLRANGLKAKVTCPFVKKWLERHPEERDLVV